MRRLAPSDPMPDRLEAVWSWFRSGLVRILDRRGRLVPFDPNPLQRRLFGEVLRQAKEGRPVRIIVLKARKEGVSTFIQLLMLGLAKFTPGFHARTIAHTEDSTQDIHEIVRRAVRHFPADDPFPATEGNPIRFPHDSSITTRTAGGRHVSSGATVNALHISELAKWPGDEKGVQAQLASVMQSVPAVPESLVVIESTANMIDSSGEFERRWRAAESGRSTFAPLFSPWFEDASYRVDGDWPGPVDEYERWLVDEFGLDAGQLQWRRNKIAGDFAGQTIWFMQEYPATPEESFQKPTGLVFPMLDERVHDRSIPEDLRRRAQIWRGIDFGATDPFVCLWVAHFPDEPAGLTVDRKACPNTWRELTRYRWRESGIAPVDANDHTCDALRYVVTHYELYGHVHVFREIYEPNTATRGMSLLDLAAMVRNLSSEDVLATVCDRSQPGTIQLFNDYGLSCEPTVPPKSGRRNEKIDGIIRLQALMVATQPLRRPIRRDEHEPILEALEWEARARGVHRQELSGLTWD